MSYFEPYVQIASAMKVQQLTDSLMNLTYCSISLYLSRQYVVWLPIAFVSSEGSDDSTQTDTCVHPESCVRGVHF